MVKNIFIFYSNIKVYWFMVYCIIFVCNEAPLNLRFCSTYIFIIQPFVYETSVQKLFGHNLTWFYDTVVDFFLDADVAKVETDECKLAKHDFIIGNISTVFTSLTDHLVCHSLAKNMKCQYWCFPPKLDFYPKPHTLHSMYVFVSISFNWFELNPWPCHY